METLQIVLIGAGILALAWFLLKFGKVLARAALVAGVLGLGIILALGLLENTRATRTAVKVATVAGAGAAGASGVAFLLGGMLLVALGAVGYLAVRVKLLERGTLLPKQKRRERLPDAGRVVYIVKARDESEPVWEVNEWLSDDWQL